MALGPILRVLATAAKQGGRYTAQAGKQTVKYVQKNPSTAKGAVAGVAGTLGTQYVFDVVGDAVNGFQEFVTDPFNLQNPENPEGQSSIMPLLVVGGVVAALGLGIYAVAKEA